MSRHDHRRHRHHAAPGAGGAGRAAPAGGGLGRLTASLALTSVIMVAEAIGGWASGSLALISDAGHMLTDAGALALALGAAWLARRPADDRRTYGWRRAEVLAAQANAAALIGLTAWIGGEAVGRLRHGGPPIDLRVMAGVAAVGLVANLAALLVLRDEHGINARSAFLHVVADTVSSVAVLASAGIMWWRPVWTFLDPALSLLIAALILGGALGIVGEIADVLMESVPGHLDLGEVTRGMTAAGPGVLAIHDLHIWTISSGLHALSAHVVVAPAALGRNDEILASLKVALRDRYGIDHTTLQIESADYRPAHDACAEQH